VQSVCPIWADVGRCVGTCGIAGHFVRHHARTIQFDAACRLRAM